MAKKEKEAKQEPQAQAPTIAFVSQYIKDLSFEAPNMPQILAEAQGKQPQINVHVDVNGKKIDGNNYEVRLVFKVDAKANDKTLFICELDYGTLVQVNAAEEHIEPILSIEIPRHLFPFVRSIIADMTREGGFPPLMLNPIDFMALYAQRKGTATA